MAANIKGIQLVRELIGEYSLGTVTAYMDHIQANAEAAVRDMLKDFSLQQVRGEAGSSRQAEAGSSRQ